MLNALREFFENQKKRENDTERRAGFASVMVAKHIDCMSVEEIRGLMERHRGTPYYDGGNHALYVIEVSRGPIAHIHPFPHTIPN